MHCGGMTQPTKRTRDTAPVPRRPLLLAEELLLLLLDDVSGRVTTDGTRLTNGLAGAMLLELAVDEHVGITTGSTDGPGGVRAKPGRLAVLANPRPADPELAVALDKVAERAGRKPKDALPPLVKGLKERLLERLAAAGLITRQRGRLLGFIPNTTWPTVDPGPEREVRERLRQVLVDGQQPDQRTAALVALLSATDAVHKALPDADKRLVKKRARQIAEGEWASDAVRRAVAETETAVMTAIMASTVAASASAGS